MHVLFISVKLINFTKPMNLTKSFYRSVCFLWPPICFYFFLFVCDLFVFRLVCFMQSLLVCWRQLGLLPCERACVWALCWYTLCGINLETVGCFQSFFFSLTWQSVRGAATYFFPLICHLHIKQKMHGQSF